LSRAWPLPALLAWSACWLVFWSLRSIGSALPLCAAVAMLVGGALAATASTPWRRLFVGLGFPLSCAASGLGSGLGAWPWLALLALLALAYPVGAWRDAPFFPTPSGILAGLDRRAPLAAGARIVDLGCGLGDGLLELGRRYPQARLEGVEWSWPLRLAAALRCRFASVRRGDMWAEDWSPYAMVYLFQRPESMDRAWRKAVREMAPGSWLASLEFEVPGRPADVILAGTGERHVFVYRMPASGAG